MRWTLDPYGSPATPSRSPCWSPNWHTREKGAQNWRTASSGWENRKKKESKNGHQAEWLTAIRQRTDRVFHCRHRRGAARWQGPQNQSRNEASVHRHLGGRSRKPYLRAIVECQDSRLVPGLPHRPTRLRPTG